MTLVLLSAFGGDLTRDGLLAQAPAAIGQSLLYCQFLLTMASRMDVMNQLGRAMADPTRSRILLTLLRSPGYPPSSPVI